MAAERRLSVDWPACKGHGLCAELVPELITLDEWGYPILSDRPVTRGVQSHAQRAVAACPTLALMLVEKPAEATPAPRPAANDPISGAIQAATGPMPRRAPTTPPTGPTRVRESGPSPRREAAAPEPVRSRRRRGEPEQPSRPQPADDPITGAILAVTGPNARSRRTPPTGVARHATPAYGQPTLVPEPESHQPGDAFFDAYQPRDAYQPGDAYQPRGAYNGPSESLPAQPPPPKEPAQPGSRREARENQQPRTRREARARRQ